MTEIEIQDKRIMTGEQLSESENRFRNLTELSSDWYWEQDVQLRFTIVSPGFQKIFRLKSGIYLGKTLWELDNIFMSQEEIAFQRADFDSRRSFRDIVYRFKDEDDKPIWILLSGDPIYDAEERFKGYRGVGSDITARKRMEEALRASNVALQAIFLHATGGIARIDPQGRYLQANPALCALLGYNELEICELTIAGITHEQDWPTSKQLLEELVTGSRRMFANDQRLKRKNGDHVWTHNTFAPVRNETGNMQYLIVQTEDITNQILVDTQHRALTEREHKLSRLSFLALRETRLQNVFVSAMECVRDVLGVDFVKVLKLDQNRDILKLVAGIGWNPGTIGTTLMAAELEVQAGYTLYAAALETGMGLPRTPAIVEDFAREERFRAPALLQNHGVKSGMTVVLYGGTHPYGVLGAHSRSPRQYTDGDSQFLQAVANIIAASVERASALDSLRETRHLLERAQETAGLGYWEYEPRTDRFIWSEMLHTIMGVPPSDHGSGLEDNLRRVHAGDRGRLRAAVQNMLAHKKKSVGEYRIERPNGEQRMLLINGEPVLDEAGGVVKLIGTCFDITGQRLAAEKLLAMTRKLVDTQEAERRKIAAELHDRVGQNLTALAINLETIRSGIDLDPSALIARRFSDSLALVEATSKTIGNVMAELRPPMLDNFGLGTAIAWYGESFQSRTGIQVQVDNQYGVKPTQHQSRDMALFRIVQEALNNVAKHAHARNVKISLCVSDVVLQLVLQDDGDGFNPRHEQRNRPSMGLSMMQERAAAVGGNLAVDTAMGCGTTLTVMVPL